MPIVITKPVITATYLVVDENGTVTSTHPQKIEVELTADGFIQALNDLLEAKDNLELSDGEVHMLMRTGNLISLGNVQAATLGVQSQYQFPTTVGSQGQVIGYQGTSQLAWVNAGGGSQGFQGYQGLQGAGTQGSQGSPGTGSQGSQGFQGYQGLQGAGLQGSQGNQGGTGGAQGFQGTQGLQGYQGYQGLQGAGLQGPVGGFSLPYTFNTSTIMSAATGEVRFNNSTPSLVTNIDISKTDRNSATQTAVLDQIVTGTILKFFAETNSSAQYGFYKTTGVTKNSTEYNFSVTYQSSLGSIFTNSAAVDFDTALAGAQGLQGGGAGSQGFQGYQGYQGLQGSGSQGSQGAPGSGSQGSQGSTGFQGFQGQKAAIMPIQGVQAEEYVELLCVEAPDVRFEDVVILTAGNQGYQSHIVGMDIDRRFLQVCDVDTIRAVSAVPSVPVSVGAVIRDGRLILEVQGHGIEAETIEVVVKLSGIRKGLSGRRFAQRSYNDMVKNNAFWDSATK